MSEAQSGTALAATLAAFVDTLIPGDGGRWPSASAVGVHGVLPGRMIELRGPDGVDELLAAIARCGGLPEGTADRGAVIVKLEAEHPALFAAARSAVYLAYYDSPAVVAVIRALGHRYRAMPHAAGYPLPPFDPARDSPRHARGHFIPTDQVRRVDLSGLDFIAASGRGDRG